MKSHIDNNKTPSDYNLLNFTERIFIVCVLAGVTLIYKSLKWLPFSLMYFLNASSMGVDVLR